MIILHVCMQEKKEIPNVNIILKIYAGITLIRYLMKKYIEEK